MKHKRLVLTLTAALLSAAMLVGCGSGGPASSGPSGGTAPAAKAEVNVYGIKGPTGVGMVHLMDAQDKARRPTITILTWWLPGRGPGPDHQRRSGYCRRPHQSGRRAVQ